MATMTRLFNVSNWAPGVGRYVGALAHDELNWLHRLAFIVLFLCVWVPRLLGGNFLRFQQYLIMRCCTKHRIRVLPISVPRISCGEL
jgi:hypothetical protein